MPRNIEIKARASNFKHQTALAEKLADGPPEHLVQTDTFFNVPSGRLKLRVFDGGHGELIQYERSDTTGPKQSCYVRAEVENPNDIHDALSKALGVRSVVRKQRDVYLADRTRIHMDRVEGLGEFIELEVVMSDSEENPMGEQEAMALMSALEIADSDLVDAAYVDLLERIER